MSKQSKILELANQIISLISSHNTDTSAHTNLFNNKEDKSNKNTNLNSQSTHTQYPTSKTVYDALSDCVKTSDSRLSDARTPKSHTHTKSEISNFPTSMTPTNHSHTLNEISVSAISTATDFNTLKTQGFYKFAIKEANSSSNHPTNRGGLLEVKILGFNAGIAQTYYEYNNGGTKNVYYRTYHIDSGWDNWSLILNSNNYSNYANKTTVSNSLTDTSTTNALSANQGKILNDRYKGVTLASSGTNTTKPYYRLFHIESGSGSSRSSRLIFEISSKTSTAYAKFAVYMRQNTSTSASTIDFQCLEKVGFDLNTISVGFRNNYPNTSCDIYINVQSMVHYIIKVIDDQFREGTYIQYSPTEGNIEAYTSVSNAGTQLYGSAYTSITNPQWNIVATTIKKAGGTSSQVLKANGDVGTVVNDLSTGGTGNVLSAEQGKALNNRLDAMQTVATGTITEFNAMYSASGSVSYIKYNGWVAVNYYNFKITTIPSGPPRWLFTLPYTPLTNISNYCFNTSGKVVYPAIDIPLNVPYTGVLMYPTNE